MNQVTISLLEQQTSWSIELSNLIQSMAIWDIEIQYGETQAVDIVFIDDSHSNRDKIIREKSQRAKAIFLVTSQEEVPVALMSGELDGVLVRPFRASEVYSLLLRFEQIRKWSEVTQLNQSFSELIKKFQEDLGLTERLQKSRFPKRFQDFKGIRIRSRYLTGMRSGGDYFDVIPDKAGKNLSVLLTDSSSYGLSSTVLSVLLKTAAKLNAEIQASTSEIVGTIYEELALTLSPEDRLSLFYGILSRESLKMKFLNLGHSQVFHAPEGKSFQALEHQGGALSDQSGVPAVQECEVSLNASDRLIMLSDGFIELIGGEGKVNELLTRFRDKESEDTLNELLFQVRSKLKEPDDFPEQDCTAVIFDVDSKILKLA
jgi:serine phosphatase RsbU (regulator of sigma subunit)